MYNDSRPGTTHSVVFTVQYNKRIQFRIGSILSGNYCVSFSLNFLVSKQTPSNQSRRVSLSTVYEDPGTRKSHNKWLSLLLFPVSLHTQNTGVTWDISNHIKSLTVVLMLLTFLLSFLSTLRILGYSLQL